jgi:hypothetical protein
MACSRPTVCQIRIQLQHHRRLPLSLSRSGKRMRENRCRQNLQTSGQQVSQLNRESSKSQYSRFNGCSYQALKSPYRCSNSVSHHHAQPPTWLPRSFRIKCLRGQGIGGNLLVHDNGRRLVRHDCRPSTAQAVDVLVAASGTAVRCWWEEVV